MGLCVSIRIQDGHHLSLVPQMCLLGTLVALQEKNHMIMGADGEAASGINNPTLESYIVILSRIFPRSEQIISEVYYDKVTSKTLYRTSLLDGTRNNACRKF